MYGGLWFLGLGLGILSFAAILGIIFYVFMALGLYNMAKNRNIEYAWLAWIPVANLYILGLLSGNFNAIDPIKVEIKPELYLPIGVVIVGSLNFIPILSSLLGIVLAILYFVTLYRVFRQYDEEHSVIYLILSIIFHIECIFLFMMRDKEYVPLDDEN